jgi:ADP-ribose pyrophosphatase YjhB (NUDIX family)
MSKLNNNYNICNNCGKFGHLFYNCKLPITSYGIICFKYFNNELKFLMIRRKNTFGYIDFINGRYSTYNLNQLQTIINEMSNEEKIKLLNFNFDELWNDLWNGNLKLSSNLITNFNNNTFIKSITKNNFSINNFDNSFNNYTFSSFSKIKEEGIKDYEVPPKDDKNNAKKKFYSLKNGIYINNKFITLQDLLNNSNTNWNETEWEFPKGRKNTKEKDIECAFREFQEETGINHNSLLLVENVLPFEELFIGSNYKSYKYKYFLAYFNSKFEELNNFQVNEVSKLEWKNIDECLNSIRPYNLEKKKLIINIYNVLGEYRLYC